MGGQVGLGSGGVGGGGGGYLIGEALYRGDGGHVGVGSGAGRGAGGDSAKEIGDR